MQKSAVFALIFASLLLPALARPKKAAPHPVVTRVNDDENAYSYQNWRSPSNAQAPAVAGAGPRAYSASYHRAYSHLIPPDGSGTLPSAYSLGPGWANRWGSYSSGTTDYPYNAGGFVNTGFFNGGFYPGGSYTYYR